MSITLVRTHWSDPVGRELRSAQQADLTVRYGPWQGGPIPDLNPAEVEAFIVAFEDGKPIGCGAIRRESADIMEMKRIFVVPEARGRRLAGIILEALEREAVALGARYMRLETGTQQPESVRLYERYDYRPIDAFGYFADGDDTLFYGRDLDTVAARPAQPAVRRIHGVLHEVEGTLIPSESAGVMIADLAGGYAIRRASITDVPALLRLLADDDVAHARGDAPDTDPAADISVFERAFSRIDRDPAHLLVIVDSPAGEAVGTMQLTVLPGLGRGGVNRLQIESVHVATSERGAGVGSAMIRWALAEGVRRGASITQLTSDLRRTRAHEFYERLGFARSHAGFKHLR